MVGRGKRATSSSRRRQSVVFALRMRTSIGKVEGTSAAPGDGKAGGTINNFWLCEGKSRMRFTKFIDTSGVGRRVLLET